MLATAKPARTLIWKPNTDTAATTAGLLTLDVKGEAVSYVVYREPTGFQLSKLGGGEGYAMKCGSRGEVSCECPGFFYRGTCKHRDAVRKLKELRKL